METKATDLTELFGSMVFNEDAMRQYLSSNSFSAWKECIENQTALDLAIANDIADAMKHWAIERGATHFTHWFQPMTGYTAEKHDSFITPAPGGKVLLEFLRQGAGPGRARRLLLPLRRPAGHLRGPGLHRLGTPPPTPSCGTTPCIFPPCFTPTPARCWIKRPPFCAPWTR